MKIVMLFASLIIEREFPTWAKVPEVVAVWLQNAGGVSAFAVALVLIARWLSRDPREFNFWVFPARWEWLVSVLQVSAIVSAIGYVALLLIWIGVRAGYRQFFPYLPRPVAHFPLTWGDWILAGAGGCALFVAVAPILLDLASRLSITRIWAIARLSWKEAIRGRTVWVFGAMALVFLFAEWFLPYKAENQLRNYVHVVYLSMTVLFLLTAGLLGAFSIPNDVKNNSIHSIVTKPVEKFEIVLGRFLGFAGLLSLGLLILSLLSLIYVLRGVNEEAKAESYKARVPIYGRLHFAGTEDSTRGTNVGREFAYRSYIMGARKSQRDAVRQYAVWDFMSLPSDLTQRAEPIVFEFGFDIYRLSKGEEGEPINCRFTFVGKGAFAADDASLQAQRELDSKLAEMDQEEARLRAKARKDHADGLAKQGRGPSSEDDKALDKAYADIRLELLKRFRIVRRPAPLTDYHTQNVVISVEEFRAITSEGDNQAQASNQPILRVFVSPDTTQEAQLVGMAPADFYLLYAERPFWFNFLKGAVGLWCTHMLVLGVAIACSTYLSSIISFLGTLFLLIAGLFTDYLKEIAEGKLFGGGPVQSSLRLGMRIPLAGELGDNPTTTIAQFLDTAFGWWIGRVLNVIPDIARHDMHHFVANGFDIGMTDLLLLDNVLPLVGYLTPWAVLAYYLMKFREIANPS